LQKKVITRIIGGLGNQLFSYAAARRLALANNAELVIDHVTGFENEKGRYQRFYQLDHFQIPVRKATYSEQLRPFAKTRRFCKKRISRLLPYQKRSYIEQEKMDFDLRLLQLQLHKNVHIEGYWQSEDYFKDFEEIIRRDLEIIPPQDEINQELARLIKEKESVAVHIRFFDDPGSKSMDNNASIDYYSKALKKIEKLRPNAHYFVFSDRTEAVKEIFNLPEERYEIIHHNKGDEYAYADLWLMAQCKHFIIANSTFSWWGAWLAANTGKIIFAPGFKKKYGKSHWGFEGLLPDNWVKII